MWGELVVRVVQGRALSRWQHQLRVLGSFGVGGL